MSSIPQRLHNEVMMADNFTCVYCGVRAPDVGIDHFIPCSLGGPDVLQNLYTCCPKCNSRKRDRPAYEMDMTPRYGRFLRLHPKESKKKPKLRGIEERYPTLGRRGIPVCEALGLSAAELKALRRMVRYVWGQRSAGKELAEIGRDEPMRVVTDIIEPGRANELYDLFLAPRSPLDREVV